MNFRKALTFLMIIAIVAVWATPANAQIGQTDVSTFTIQNIDTTQASVTVIFVNENGQQITPSSLNASKPNPFTLGLNESFEVNVAQVPGLASGRYSVIIGSTAKVIAITSVGGRGNRAFSGSYVGFSQGANPFYLPGIVYNYFGWYSLISVQNLGTQPTNITVTLKCTNNTLTGTLTANNVPSMASHTFILRPQNGSVVPSGFTSSSACAGAATISSSNGQALVATDTQTVAADGRTQVYSGVSGGGSTLYAPALYKGYFGWESSLNILKLSTGNTTVTVRYSDGGSSTCNLTNAAPSCLLYMPGVHPAVGYFGAEMEASGGAQIVAIANASKRVNGQAITYNAVARGGSATPNWSIPAVYRNFFNWNSTFTCQNIGNVDTQIRITYEGKSGYTHTEMLSAATNESVEVAQEGEPLSRLPNGYHGSVTIEALAAGASIACISNYANRPNIVSQPGDWTTSNNGFVR